MQIWVDADACPVKDEIERLALKRSIKVIHVCALNEMKREGTNVEVVYVDQAPDAADEWIIERCGAEDIVITDDVPLAAAAVKIGAGVLQSRGQEINESNMPDRVQIRDLIMDLRDRGEMSSGPPPFSAKNRKTFTAALGRMLDKKIRRQAQG